MVLLRAVLSRTSLGWQTFLLVVAMSVACFWPFVAPKNTASWIAGGRGIAFGSHGVLLGREPLGLNNPEPSACTLDLWLQPDRGDIKGVILATYSPANSRLFRVEQFQDGLAVRSSAPGDPAQTGGAQLFADHVFAPSKPVFVTIVGSDERGTEVFVNGIFTSGNPAFRVCSRMFSGKLVAGTAAESDDPWQGLLTGLAVRSRALQSPGKFSKTTITGRAILICSLGVTASWQPVITVS